MKLLITGNKGFIGQHIEKHFMSAENDIYGWDKSGVTLNGRILMKCNMELSDDVYQVIDEIRPEVIIHCAGSADVNKSVQDHLGDLRGNYITTENILFALKECNHLSCRFVLLSSAAVYGNPISLPMNEQQKSNPLSPYALHKKAAEDVCFYMKNNCGIDIKIARLFSVYGPGLKKQIFWDMYNKIKMTGELKMLGSGEESRDYIFIDDVVAAVSLIVLDNSSTIIFNVANGKEVKIRDVAERFAHEMALSSDKIFFTGNRREGDPINWCADISKLIDLGYKQQVTLEVGVKKYVEWITGLEEGEHLK